MKSRKTNWRVSTGAMGAALMVLLLASFSAEEPEVFLKGKVHILYDANLNLAQRLELAKTEFRKSKSGDSYITGYFFMSRHKIHMGERMASQQPYSVKVDRDDIKVRRKFKASGTMESWNSKDAGEPVGLLLLHRIFKGKSEIQDARIIDLDQTYEFEDQTVYWLGKAENEESVRFLQNQFEDGGPELQKTLLHIICSHDGLKAHDFLRRIVFGNYARKVRKNAIFWLGNYRDRKSLDYLKDIIQKEERLELKKQAVFAIQLNDDAEAVAELIKIAKTERDLQVRKNAIFWLGQKASQKSIKALKEVVESEEDIKLKTHAVFAISQLPKDQSVPMLIDIAKTNKSPEVRKKAIFWLGQTGDERALKFFEEILLKK